MSRLFFSPKQRRHPWAVVQTWAPLTAMRWTAAHSLFPRVCLSPRRTWFPRQQACWGVFHGVHRLHTVNPSLQAAVCCLTARTSAAPSARLTRTPARIATYHSEDAPGLRNAERDRTGRLYSAQRGGESEKHKLSPLQLHQLLRRTNFWTFWNRYLKVHICHGTNCICLVLQWPVAVFRFEPEVGVAYTRRGWGFFS